MGNEAYDWQCPFCGKHVSLTENSYSLFEGIVRTNKQGKDGNLYYDLLYIVCPNRNCLEYTIKISFFTREEIVDKHVGRDYQKGKEILVCQLRPKGNAKPFPDYIPENLRQDYQEACLILDDSPKASATLSRRCLQGIIRQYYGITKETLNLEIFELEEELAPNLWEAVDSIRKVGNIGAHSEKDVSKIVDVKPEAASALIKLIELLFEETYIKDNHREERIRKAKEAANLGGNEKSVNDK